LLVILSGAKDLLLVLERPQPEILRRYAPQDDKEGAIPSEAGSMLVILNEVIASPEGKDLLLILDSLQPEILRRCAPQDDKAGAIPSEAGSMLVILNEVKDLAFEKTQNQGQILRRKTRSSG